MILVFLVSVASADLAVFCINNKDNALTRSGGFTEYSQCTGNICTCYAYELLCLRRRSSDKFSLESVSYSFAQSCPISECLCNLAGLGAWQTSKRINNGVPLPDPIRVELPAPEELEKLALTGSAYE